MITRQQLAAFRNTLTVAARALPAESHALLRRTAHAERARVLAEQRQRAGIAPTDAVAVDGKRNAPIDRAERLVIIEYRYLREVAQETLKALVARAPRDSGRYARGFVILADGTEIDGIEGIRHETREVVIVNTLPYARRLEIGKRADGSPFVLEVKPRIVEEVALTAARRFGNVALLRFAYFDLEGAPTPRARGRRRRAARPLRYPGIRITAR